jgi:hypothetical protein
MSEFICIDLIVSNAGQDLVSKTMISEKFRGVYLISFTHKKSRCSCPLDQ